jgi:hypothetical protein
MIGRGDQHQRIRRKSPKLDVTAIDVGGAGHQELRVAVTNHVHRLPLGSDLARDGYPRVKVMKTSQ